MEFDGGDKAMEFKGVSKDMECDGGDKAMECGGDMEFKGVSKAMECDGDIEFKGVSKDMECVSGGDLGASSEHKILYAQQLSLLNPARGKMFESMSRVLRAKAREMYQAHEYKPIKLCLLGDRGTGKSSLAMCVLVL